MKAMDETEEDMQVVTFTKKQQIAKLCCKKTTPTTLEYQFIDQNENEILKFICHNLTKRSESEKQLILEGNCFKYQACEHHQNHLVGFSIMATHFEKINN